ncbi:glycosyltransferase [Jejuia spongiicola]|uniref:Glycosyltransferase n=1 Tax=Jejuia spongiicola TaxID=2942207 RepID=A0ABT0QEC0_9FLAO|nr:glycosyltransferase [Jejuia spongiicola]MCL6294933.1 glycosyltransferase [Jejuia spongiicola]
MKLSIIVPFYNAENHIERCINSLVNQNIKERDYEIILIDDGSNDTGVMIAETFKKKHTNITIYSQHNIGLGATRNVGISLAKGDYIYFIDADDYLAYSTLNIVLNYLDIYDLELICFESSLTEKLNLFNTKTTEEIKDVKIYNGIDFLSKTKFHRITVWWYIIKRDFLIKTKLKFVEGRYMEDGPFTFSLFLQAKTVISLPLDVHRYVKVSNSIMNNDSLEHLKKMIEDYVYLIHKFNSIIVELSKKKDPKLLKVINNVKYRSQVNVYFMFYKLIKSNVSIYAINNILNNFKKIEAYPLTDFIGEEYSKRKFVITSNVFNSKFLFFILLYPLRYLYRLNIIKLV